MNVGGGGGGGGGDGGGGPESPRPTVGSLKVCIIITFTSPALSAVISNLCVTNSVLLSPLIPSSLDGPR